MADPQETDDKQHEPTQKKLDDARKKGEIARSTDLTTAAAFSGILVVSISIGSASLKGIGGYLAGLIEKSSSISTEVFSGGGNAVFGAVFKMLALQLIPWFLVPATLALLINIALRSLTFSPEKLQPKSNRVSPLANAKNKFGRTGLFEFAKSFVKLLIYSFVLGAFLYRQLPNILSSVTLNPALATVVLLELVFRFFAIVFSIAFAIGVVDYLWQRQEHIRKNRMSHKELMDEAKQNEGDPHLKQHRRQKGYEIATNRMLADVPSADVVVVNPTHYAVALKWSRLPGEAPVCVAKGVDEIATRIREEAETAGVPIHRDPPTARAIFASVNVGAEIQPDHYQAIAAAIRFAEDMRRRMQAGFGDKRWRAP